MCDFNFCRLSCNAHHGHETIVQPQIGSGIQEVGDGPLVAEESGCRRTDNTGSQREKVPVQCTDINPERVGNLMPVSEPGPTANSNLDTPETQQSPNALWSKILCYGLLATPVLVCILLVCQNISLKQENTELKRAVQQLAEAAKDCRTSLDNEIKEFKLVVANYSDLRSEIQHLYHNEHKLAFDRCVDKSRQLNETAANWRLSSQAYQKQDTHCKMKLFSTERHSRDEKQRCRQRFTSFTTGMATCDARLQAYEAVLHDTDRRLKKAKKFRSTCQRRKDSLRDDYDSLRGEKNACEFQLLSIKPEVAYLKAQNKELTTNVHDWVHISAVNLARAEAKIARLTTSVTNVHAREDCKSYLSNLGSVRLDYVSKLRKWNYKFPPETKQEVLALRTVIPDTLQSFSQELSHWEVFEENGGQIPHTITERRTKEPVILESAEQDTFLKVYFPGWSDFWHSITFALATSGIYIAFRVLYTGIALQRYSPHWSAVHCFSHAIRLIFIPEELQVYLKDVLLLSVIPIGVRGIMFVPYRMRILVYFALSTFSAITECKSVAVVGFPVSPSLVSPS